MDLIGNLAVSDTKEYEKGDPCNYCSASKARESLFELTYTIFDFSHHNSFHRVTTFDLRARHQVNDLRPV